MREVIEGTELVDVVLEGWDNAGRAVFEEEFDEAEGFEDFSPAFAFFEFVPDELVDLLPFLVVVGCIGDFVEDVGGGLPILLGGGVDECFFELVFGDFGFEKASDVFEFVHF